MHCCEVRVQTVDLLAIVHNKMPVAVLAAHAVARVFSCKRHHTANKKAIDKCGVEIQPKSKLETQSARSYSWAASCSFLGRALGMP